jgi:hypothetical protein
VIATVRRSRKRRPCHDCRDYPCTIIHPGELYVRSTLPPKADPLNAEGWSAADLCEMCARGYGYGLLLDARAAT